jgi:hypothetical protein
MNIVSTGVTGRREYRSYCAYGLQDLTERSEYRGYWA